MFRTVGLIGKHGDARVDETLGRLVRDLHARNVEVLTDAATAAGIDGGGTAVSRDELGQRADLVIVVAGDGTFLGAARSLVHHDVPLLGVNLGRLGFLADIMPHEMTERLDEIFAGDYEEERRSLLEARIVRDGATVLSAEAVNEVVLHKWNIARLIELETRIDGRLVNLQRSDGLIVSTPTGSTAYALSGGGPIIHPDLDAIVLVPICPHTLSARPLVVPPTSAIEIHMPRTDAPEAQLTCDGQTTLELDPGDVVRIDRLRSRLRLIHPADHDYYATLRAKLHWGREL